jgi:hypothetical protein
MKTKGYEKTMGRFGRGMMALTLMVGALLWMGSAHKDRATTAAKASTIERIAPADAPVHFVNADTDTLDLQLD